MKSKKTSFITKIINTMVIIMGLMFNIYSPISALASASSSPIVIYNAHCQDIGWIGYVSNGATAGTTGQVRPMEAVQIKLNGINGGITYRAHCRDIGWMGWVSNGATAGTTGQVRAMEAVQIKLTGAAASLYDVVYRSHCRDIGWTNWVSNGATAGTTGQVRPMEAVQIKLVPKTNSSYTQKMNAFISDPRWDNGSPWSASQKPLISSYGSSGCCAYAADFTKYVFNSNSVRSNSIFYSPNNIRAGDILYVTGGSHWIVVLERSGNSLKTAEGNWGSKVVISNGTYTISGNTLLRNGSKFRTFNCGYHFQ